MNTVYGLPAEPASTAGAAIPRRPLRPHPGRPVLRRSLSPPLRGGASGTRCNRLSLSAPVSTRVGGYVLPAGIACGLPRTAGASGPAAGAVLVDDAHCFMTPEGIFDVFGALTVVIAVVLRRCTSTP